MGGRESGGISLFEKQLVEKDLNDKAHSSDPIDGMMIRDRFLYFSMSAIPIVNLGFTLRIPKSKGILQRIVLKCLPRACGRNSLPSKLSHRVEPTDIHQGSHIELDPDSDLISFSVFPGRESLPGKA